MPLPLLDVFRVSNILLWLLITGGIAFAAMGFDKLMAVTDWGSRVREKTLWTVALCGGFLGIIVGGTVFHHKTSKTEFWPPVVLAALLWASLLIGIATGYLDR